MINVSSEEMIMFVIGEPTVSITSTSCIPRNVHRLMVWSREAAIEHRAQTRKSSSLMNIPEMRRRSSCVRATDVTASVCCSIECSTSPVSSRRTTINRSREPATMCSLLCETVIHRISSWWTLQRFSDLKICHRWSFQRFTCRNFPVHHCSNWTLWWFDLSMQIRDAYCYGSIVLRWWLMCGLKKESLQTDWGEFYDFETCEFLH